MVLIDVRTPKEFAEARLHGALNAPLQTFDPATIPMEAGRETILYCRSSGRSGRAAKILAEHIDGKADHSYRLWILLNLEILQRLYFEGATIDSTAAMLQSYVDTG